MREHGSLPRARKEGLLVEAVGEELLLYDQHSHTAHCLSPIAACVWRHCDGEHDVAEFARLAGVSENLVGDALHELREKDLVDGEPQLTQSAIPGVSRRQAIGRFARIGAAAAAPFVVSATAATPAMASSGEKVETCVEASKSTCCLCNNGACESNLNEIKCKEYCNGRGGIAKFAEEMKCSKD